jgi:hypothetical protein
MPEIRTGSAAWRGLKSTLGVEYRRLPRGCSLQTIAIGSRLRQPFEMPLQLP